MAEKNYQASKDKYLKEKVDTFVLRVPKGQKDKISLYAKNKGMSLNGYITGLVFEDMGIKDEKIKAGNKKTANINKRPAKKVPKNTSDKKPIERANEKKKESSRKSMPSFLL